jgi:DNA-binding CsgD family transcriptional regulator
MRSDVERELDPRKVFIGRLMVQLIRRGWRPPKQLPPRGMHNLIDDMERVSSFSPNSTLNLSAHQVRVLEMMSQGHDQAAIAEIVGTSYQSVKITSKEARRKLGANNSVHAVAIAIREGVI